MCFNHYLILPVLAVTGLHDIDEYIQAQLLLAVSAVISISVNVKLRS